VKPKSRPTGKSIASLMEHLSNGNILLGNWKVGTDVAKSFVDTGAKNYYI
jgi:hypothetical protein